MNKCFAIKSYFTNFLTNLFKFTAVLFKTCGYIEKKYSARTQLTLEKMII